MQTVDIINNEELFARVAGDEELLHEIVELFMEDHQNHLFNIKNALNKKDAAQLVRAAHTLKGAVATFAAKSATQAALKLELMGRSRNFNGSSEAYMSLEKEIELLKQALTSFCSTPNH
ncbi:Hpt domain-containing protein [candidate division KSB1 bacterium]|nr:Hpt domain-containing protein [candidate division KSB1 bacterium]